jgi:hypothetical protein
MALLQGGSLCGSPLKLYFIWVSERMNGCWNTGLRLIGM